MQFEINMMSMSKKNLSHEHNIRRKINLSPNRIANRSSSSLNMLKAVTIFATMSTLSEGFAPNSTPNRCLSSPSTNMPLSSNVYGLHQSLRSPSQCEMVMMDVDTVLGDTNINKRTQSKKDEEFPIGSLPKVSGYHTSGVRDPARKRSQNKKAAATLELVDNKLNVNKKKDRKKLPSNKPKRTSIKRVNSNDKGKSPKLQLVAPTKQRIVHKQKETLTEKEEVDSILSSIVSEAVTKKEEKKTRSRSSTMPGLAYSNTMRMKAYQDGLDIVEQKTGRSIRNSYAIESKRRAVRKNNSEQMYGQSVSVPDSLIQFVGEIHQESRITPQEEKDLGSKTQEAIRLQNLYEDLGDKLNREPTDAEYCAAAGKINMEALRQTIEEGLEAKNRLVTSNLRMVQRVVNLYLRNGLGSEYNAGDLMQDGTVVSLLKILHNLCFT